MIYASVCSGVEAASLAWIPLGWKAAWFSEIEPFPCAVLKHRFPEVPNLGDMTKIKVETIENETGKIQKFTNGSGTAVVVPGGVDLLVGGTPCQSFSVAGNRAGLRGVSGLALTYCRLLEAMHPRWFVWENVPGVFSSNGGEDFKTLLKAFDEIGYSCAWRVLDAQYVRVDGYPRAVPQRRRRVFVVGHLGDWRYPASVLFEPESVHRNTPPRRVKGAGVARCLTASTGGASGKEQQHTFVICNAGFMGCQGSKAAGIAYSDEHAPTIKASSSCSNSVPDILCVHGAQDPISNDSHANALGCTRGLENCVCVSKEMKPEGRFWNGDDVAGTLTGTSNSQLMPNKGRLQCVIEPREDSVECLDIRQVEVHEKDLSPTLIATDYKGGKVICYENHAQDSRIKEIDCAPVLSAKAGTGGNNLPLVAAFMGGQGSKAGGIGYSESVSPTLKAAASGSNQVPAVAIAENVIGRKVENGGNGIGAQEEVAYTQNCTGVMGVAARSSVRRLLPVECERLMGFPDNWTRIAWKGTPEEECPDAPRYKACGNSMCVNVMRWIGMRIELTERKLK